MNYVISDRANPVYRNFATYRGQMWGHIPLTDECFDFFENVNKYIQPKHILEFGTNMTFSASIQLETFQEAKLTTFDVKMWPWNGNNTLSNLEENGLVRAESHRCVNLAKLVYGERFNFIQDSSRRVRNYIKPDEIDYVFIDGDHTYKGTVIDIQNSMRLKIPYMIIDNLEMTQIQEACAHFGDALELLDEKSYDLYHPVNNPDTKRHAILRLYRMNYEHFLS